MTIPDAPRDVLDAVVRACEQAQVPCRFVRSDLDLDPVVAWRRGRMTTRRRPGGGCGRAHVARPACTPPCRSLGLHLACRAVRVPVVAVLTPWLFTDELELTQLSRSIADTGEAARRGEPHFFETLYTYLTAPAWWIDSTAQAYDLVRYIGVFTMTAVVFPTYFLARTIVGKRRALFAAAGAGAVPGLRLLELISEEALAYSVRDALLLPDREGDRDARRAGGSWARSSPRSSRRSCAPSWA